MKLCSKDILSAPDLTVMELNFYEFLEKVVSDGKRDGGPKDPCSYQIEMLETVSKGKLRGYMVFALIKFANEICGKKIATVSWEDVSLIQRYFHSFGFEILYKPDEAILAGKNGDESQLGFRDYRMWFQPYVH